MFCDSIDISVKTVFPSCTSLKIVSHSSAPHYTQLNLQLLVS
jgi:hypothetical protein